MQGTASPEYIDEVMWEWFTKARAKNIPVSGRVIQVKRRTTVQCIDLLPFPTWCGGICLT